MLHCPVPLGPLRLNLPLVVTVHDAMAIEHPEWFTGVNATQQRVFLPRLLRRAAAVLTPSEHTRTRVLELFELDPGTVTVAPWGVEERFSPGVAEPPAEAPYLLAVGALQPRKGIETTLAAFEALADRGAPHRLVIAGPRGWRDQGLLDRLRGSRHANRVEVRGHVTDDELVGLYRGADCLVAASLYEGFGFTVLEAMACGTPVVASSATSHPEVLGDAGLLFTPGDPAALARTLSTLLESRDLRAKLSERGLRRAGAFTWERCAELTVGAYRRAIERWA